MIRKYKIYIIMGITVILLLWFYRSIRREIGKSLGTLLWKEKGMILHFEAVQ